MQVFVTGGTGLVGRALIARLSERGDQVVCLSRDPQKAAGGLPDGVRIIAGDPVVPGDWQQEVACSHAVVNLAGESIATGLWTRGKKRRLRRSRLSTTANLVEALNGNDRPAVLVSASATGYYGDGGDAALPETSEPGQDFLARLALEWEHTAQQAAGDHCRVVVVRIGVVLAREGGALPKLITPLRLGVGGHLGNGRQYFPWIHLDDLVRVLVYALDNQALSGPVNAVAPDPPTQAEFTRALAAALDKRPLLPVPRLVLKLLLGEKADLLLASQRAVPNVLKANGFRFEFAELPEALADLV